MRRASDAGVDFMEVDEDSPNSEVECVHANVCLVDVLNVTRSSAHHMAAHLGQTYMDWCRRPEPVQRGAEWLMTDQTLVCFLTVMLQRVLRVHDAAHIVLVVRNVRHIVQKLRCLLEGPFNMSVCERKISLVVVDGNGECDPQLLQACDDICLLTLHQLLGERGNRTTILSTDKYRSVPEMRYLLDGEALEVIGVVRDNARGIPMRVVGELRSVAVEMLEYMCLSKYVGWAVPWSNGLNAHAVCGVQESAICISKVCDECNVCGV
jgi:hypothetical protein